MNSGAAVEVLGEQHFAFGVGNEIGEQIVEVRFALFAIAVPPYGILGRCIDDRMFIFGASAGVVAGLGAERAALDEVAFLVGDGVFHEPGVG